MIRSLSLSLGGVKYRLEEHMIFDILELFSPENLGMTKECPCPQR